MTALEFQIFENRVAREDVDAVLAIEKKSLGRFFCKPEARGLFCI